MLVGLDSEAHRITRAEMVPRLVVVQTYDEVAGSRLWHRHDPRTPGVLADLFEHHHVTLANASFDALVFLRAWPELWPVIRYAYESDRVHDVLKREALLCIADGTLKQRRKSLKLDALALHHCGIVVPKDEDGPRLRYGELERVPIEQWPADAIEYALRDPWATWCVHRKQDEIRWSSYGDVLANEGHQVRTGLALASQSVRGLDTDRDNALAQLSKMDREIAELEWWVQHAGLARTEKGRVVKTRAAAEQAVLDYATSMGLVAKQTDKGATAVSQTALADLSLPKPQRDAAGRYTWIHPLDAYRTLGGLQAMRTKWFPFLLQPHVWTNYYNPVESGRTSSAGSKLAELVDVTENLQNIPRTTTYAGFRECFRARPGKRLLVSDWSGIEFGTHAQNELDTFGRSALADLLAADVDVHAATGMSMLGLPREAYDKRNPEHRGARQNAKPVGFGDMGMLGPRKLVTFARDKYDVRLTESEARAHLDARHRMLPEISQYHRLVKDECPYGSTCTVVQPRSGRIRGGCMATDAANTRFQGLAGDVAGTALWWLLCESLDPTSILYAQFQVLFVHDENVTEVDDDDRIEARLHRQEEIMIRAFNWWCPDVRIKVESKHGVHYTKG